MVNYFDKIHDNLFSQYYTIKAVSKQENTEVNKGKAIPIQAWTGHEAPRFQDNRHMNVVRLSALLTGSIYSPGNIPCTHFC